MATNITENFDPEKVIRYEWDDKGIYSRDAAWDIMADEVLVSVVQLVDASDYDKLLALYRALQPQMTLAEKYGTVEIK